MGQRFYDDDGYVRTEEDPVPEQLALPNCMFCGAHVYQGRSIEWFHRATGSTICAWQDGVPLADRKRATPLVWTDAE